MSEGVYRWVKSVLLAVLVVGTVCWGWRAVVILGDMAENGREMAKNGRYVQYDQDKGWVSERGPSGWVFDTRTGRSQQDDN